MSARVRGARQWLLIGGIAFLATTVAFAALGIAWAHDLRAPRVALLGSGNGDVSALITAGNARVLIATGDDPAELLTALERARHPIARRLDLALLVGDGRDLLGPAAIATDLDVRYLATIGYLPRSPEAEAIRTAGAVAVTMSRRIALADDVTIDLELDNDEEHGQTLWRTIVRRHGTAIILLSDSNAAEHFQWSGPASALVVMSADGEPLAAWRTFRTPLLAFPDDAISGAELRERATSGNAPDWAIRVFPGEATRLTFGPDGLVLGASSAVPVGTPASGRWRELPAVAHGRTRREFALATLGRRAHRCR